MRMTTLPTSSFYKVWTVSHFKGYLAYISAMPVEKKIQWYSGVHLRVLEWTQSSQEPLNILVNSVQRNYVPRSLQFLCSLVLGLPLPCSLVLTYHFWGYYILTHKSHKHGPLSIVVELLTLALGLQIYNYFGTMICGKQIKSFSPFNIPCILLTLLVSWKQYESL